MFIQPYHRAAPPRIFVTGGTGYLGRRVVHALLAQGASVTVLARRGAPYQERLGPLLPYVHVVTGDVWNPASIAGQARGHAAVIHLVGGRGADPARGLTHRHMNYTAARSVIAMAAGDGVRRFVYVNCVGDPPQISAFSESQLMAEQHLKRQGMDWMIIRAPRLVGGERRHTLLSLSLKLLRFVPLWRRLTPVPVGMAGWAVAYLALDPTAYNRIYYGPALRRLGHPQQAGAPQQPLPPAGPF
ncbi:MAG: NAD(P)H-binding protein [Anaerolineae bacterium]|nr:NAD(P)H-binding protein [Anaerolineae bacterium]